MVRRAKGISSNKRRKTAVPHEDPYIDVHLRVPKATVAVYSEAARMCEMTPNDIMNAALAITLAMASMKERPL